MPVRRRLHVAVFVAECVMLCIMAVVGAEPMTDSAERLVGTPISDWLGMVS